jgi:hypothetical protein
MTAIMLNIKRIPNISKWHYALFMAHVSSLRRDNYYKKSPSIKLYAELK